MIDRATLTRIDRVATTGRTGPLLCACEPLGEDQEVELFVKLSYGCDQGVINLAREVIAACLAADLGLPVPKPWLVEIPVELIDAVQDPNIVNKLRTSNPIAFGSTRSQGFNTWISGTRINQNSVEIALSILLFDAVIQNPDRHVGNPNCLMKGDAIRIIDHELAFAHRLILFWKQPWVLQGMDTLCPPDPHIFFNELKRADRKFDGIKARWQGLSDIRLQEYEAALPPEWLGVAADVTSALRLIADARDNIDGCIAELERILA